MSNAGLSVLSTIAHMKFNISWLTNVIALLDFAALFMLMESGGGQSIVFCNASRRVHSCHPHAVT